MVEICHLYENVHNRPQNKKKIDGVRKTLLSDKIKMAAMKLLKLLEN